MTQQERQGNTRLSGEPHPDHPKPCRMVDGTIAQMCDAMNGMIGSYNGHHKGLNTLELHDLNTGQTRVAGVLYAPKGGTMKGALVLNFCPWCGVKIEYVTGGQGND